jgi:hypothetical protein
MIERVTQRRAMRDTDLLLAAGSGAVVVACLLTPAAAQAGPVICPFRLATGLECPGCGSIRAWTFAMHGDAGAALAANPFAVGLLAFTILAIAWRLIEVAYRGEARWHMPAVNDIARSRVTWFFIGAWIIFGVVRIGLNA